MINRFNSDQAKQFPGKKMIVDKEKQENTKTPLKANTEQNATVVVNRVAKKNESGLGFDFHNIYINEICKPTNRKWIEENTSKPIVLPSQRLLAKRNIKTKKFDPTKKLPSPNHKLVPKQQSSRNVIFKKIQKTQQESDPNNICCIKGCRSEKSCRNFSSLRGNWEIKKNFPHLKICSHHYNHDFKLFSRGVTKKNVSAVIRQQISLNKNLSILDPNQPRINEHRGENLNFLREQNGENSEDKGIVEDGKGIEGKKNESKEDLTTTSTTVTTTEDYSTETEDEETISPNETEDEDENMSESVESSPEKSPIVFETQRGYDASEEQEEETTDDISEEYGVDVFNESIPIIGNKRKRKEEEDDGIVFKSETGQIDDFPIFKPLKKKRKRRIKRRKKQESFIEDDEDDEMIGEKEYQKKVEMCCIKGCGEVASIRNYASLRGDIWELKENKKNVQIQKICNAHYLRDLKKFPRDKFPKRIHMYVPIKTKKKRKPKKKKVPKKKEKKIRKEKRGKSVSVKGREFFFDEVTLNQTREKINLLLEASVFLDRNAL